MTTTAYGNIRQSPQGGWELAGLPYLPLLWIRDAPTSRDTPPAARELRVHDGESNRRLARLSGDRVDAALVIARWLSLCVRSVRDVEVLFSTTEPAARASSGWQVALPSRKTGVSFLGSINTRPERSGN